MTITNKEVEAIADCLKNDDIHSYACTCGGNPEIIVERTAWGTPAILMKCQMCGDTSSGMGIDHIEALHMAVDQWDCNQECKALPLIDPVGCVANG